MAKPNRDVRLAEAIICIDPLSGEVAILTMPDKGRVRDRFPYVFGACDPYWASNSEETLRGELLVHIWHVVIFHGIKPAAAHEALLAIPEYRDFMKP